MGALNELLAYKPWAINELHLRTLSQPDESGGNSWNLAEIVHVSMILTHFHSLCCLAFGQGVLKETDVSLYSKKKAGQEEEKGHGAKKRSFENFNPKQENYLSLFDFSWEQNAQEQFREVLVVQPTNLIDKQFNYVANLTNEYIADSQENTAPLRECMRVYTEHIFGVHHDDYDYSQVN